ncbi:MAG TPA: biopolymer transporter ExbD [Phycisphaerae bacterium]|nr:biopolymer transporter ExbD [Phycisphaerae bacterium]
MAQSLKQVEGEEAVHYVSARKMRGVAKPKMQPPLTPMIDVTFQLLLYFLLTMTFRQAEGQIPGTLPEKGIVNVSRTEDLRDPIRIRLWPQGEDNKSASYEMGNFRYVEPENLFQALLQQQTQLGSRDIPVTIEPKPNVRWTFVVEAFNQAVRAKFENIGFVTED